MKYFTYKKCVRKILATLFAIQSSLYLFGYETDWSDGQFSFHFVGTYYYEILNAAGNWVPKYNGYVESDKDWNIQDALNRKTGSGELIIPHYTKDGFGVITTIDDFSYGPMLSVIISDGIDSIRYGAFRSCNFLTSIEIPESIVSIESGVFALCTSLKSLTIPNGIKEIADNLFWHCTNLQSVSIPESVTRIGKEAFSCCKSLSSISIPSHVTEIGKHAFDSCFCLSSIEIPTGVKKINEYAFSGCTGLTSIEIPETVTEIGDHCFSGCNNFTAVKFPEHLDISKTDLSFIHDGIRYRVLTNTTVSVAGLSDDEYSGDIVIPEEVSVGNTFKVVSIDDRAFQNSKITSVSFSKNITSIPKQAFFSCKNLTSLIIPSNITKIEDGAFEWCSGLTSITIPESITEIESSVFCGCTNLTSLTLPSTITKIGEEAFRGCSCLLVIPDGVEEIGERAFWGCSMHSLTIPSSVSKIGENAFAFLSLQAITFLSQKPVSNKALFSESLYNYAILYVPCESQELYKKDNIYQNFKNIKCYEYKNAEEILLTQDDISINPDIYTADISFPKLEEVNKYELTIYTGEEFICTITFNENGILLDISFSELKSNSNGFQFTLTGLSPATTYSYLLQGKSSSNTILKEFSGTFTTKEEEKEIIIEEEESEILSISQDYNISVINKTIFVNDNAPEFVITNLGQKIINQNLKPGIYFIIINGRNIKVLL